MSARHAVRIAIGVALLLAVATPTGIMIAAGANPPPPCPSYRLHVTGGKWTPHYVSFTRVDFERYTEAVRREARGECRVIARGPAPTATKLTPAQTAPHTITRGKP